MKRLRLATRVSVGLIFGGAAFTHAQVLPPAGEALSFDGVDDVVVLGGNAISPPWTAEMWILREVAFNDSAILLGDLNTALKIEQFQNTRKIGFTQFGVADYSFNYIAPSNTWLHLAFVCDTTTRLYVNGVLQDTINATISLPLGQMGGDVISPPHYNNHFRGFIDEFRIWNTARTSLEIQTCLGRILNVPQQNLAAYWRFDEGFGTLTHDLTGNGHDGTLTFGPQFVFSDAPLLPAVPPPGVSTLAASLLTVNGATLNGLVTPEGASGWAWFEWGDTSAYGYLTEPKSFSPETEAKVQAALSVLASGAPYHYRAVAINGSGNPVAGPDQSFIAAENSTLSSTWCTDFSDGLPAGAILSGSAMLTPISGLQWYSPQVLSLTLADLSQQGTFIVPSPNGALPVTSFSISFNAYIGGGSEIPADGLSVNFASDLPLDFGEEGAGSGLTVSFDTYDNGGGEAPAIDVSWNNQPVGHVPVNVHFNDFVPIQITLHEGGALDLSWNNEAIFSALPTGYVPIAGQFGFGARTGASTENHFISDLCITAQTLNTEPTIEPVPSQTIVGGTAPGPIPLVVGDRESPPNQLMLTATSSNQKIVPNVNLTITRPGANNILTVVPAQCAFGTADITLTVTDPQGASAKTTFTMTFVPIVLSNLVQTYDGTPKTISVTAAPGGQPPAITYDGNSTPPVDAGTYQVVASATDPNCNASITDTLVINKAPLAITALDDTKTYGDSRTYGPGSTAFRSLGLRSQDTIGSVTMTASGGTAANANVGTYLLSPASATGGSFNANNYIISYNAGSLTVNPLPVVLTGTRPYDTTATADAGILLLANLVPNDVITFAGNVILAGKDVGPENITSFNGLAVKSPNGRNSNYTLVGASGTVTVTKAAASVMLSNLRRTFNGTPQVVNATTVPLGLNVAFTYNQSPNPPINAGSYPVLATVNDPNYTGSASNTLVIDPALAAVVLGNLKQTFDGNPHPVTAISTPPVAAISLTYNGNASPPINAGSYPVLATVNDPNYAGSTSNTLVIDPALAAVVLGNLKQTFDGNPHPVTPISTPPVAAISVTYNGNVSPPINAGSYPVLATVNDPNYTGSASNTLVIDPALAAVVLGNLKQTFDGNPHPVTATSTPPVSAISLTYNGNASPPITAGSYPVLATVSDPNYTGSTTDTLVIAPVFVTINLENLNQTFDGNPKSVTATPIPNGLSVNVTYDGVPSSPTNAGTYEIIATVSEVNYTGSVTDALVVAKAPASVILSDLVQNYDGLPKTVHAATAPAGLALTISYDSSLNAPTQPGTYNIVVSISDPNYIGLATGTFVIQQLPALGIQDVTIREGDTGYIEACFTVTLSAPSDKVVLVDFATSDGTALAGDDYESASGTLIFEPQKGTLPGIITNPDLPALLAENPRITPQGRNIIVSWPLVLEEFVLQQRDSFDCGTGWSNANGSSERTDAGFKMLLPLEASHRFFRLFPGSGFSPAETSRSFTINIKGDLNFEPDEVFFVNLMNSSNATIAKGHAKCTILNDDGPTLSIRRSGEEWLLSWPSTADKYVLQAQSDLSESGDWVDVDASKVIVGGEFQVLEPSSEHRFYRLRFGKLSGQ